MASADKFSMLNSNPSNYLLTCTPHHINIFLKRDSFTAGLQKKLKMENKCFFKENFIGLAYRTINFFMKSDFCTAEL